MAEATSIVTHAPDRPGITLGVETRSIDWVPDAERHGKVWHQGPLWFLGNLQYFTIALGFVGPSLGLPLGQTVLAGVLGIAVGTLFMAFHASQGPVLGLPQMIQSRAQFGYRGVVLVLIGTLFTYLGFNVADQVLLSQGLSGVFGWSPGWVAGGTAVLAILLAVYGHDWVHRAFRWLLYLSLPLMLLVTAGVLSGHAGGHPPSQHLAFTWTAFFAQFSAAAAYNITYAPYVSDYSRYLPRTTSARSLIASVFFGASGSAVWLIALGAWLAIRLGASDGLVGLRDAGDHFIPGLGAAAAVLSALSLIATMGMNAYGGMLTVLTGIDSFRSVKPTRAARIVTILGLAGLWFTIASLISANAVSTVFTALTLMLYLLVPWTATNLVDFFWVRRGHYAIADLFTPAGVYGAWSRRGLSAYVIGFAAEIPFMVLPDLGGWTYTGPGAQQLGGTDIAWVVGLVVAALAYLVASRTLDRSAESRAMTLSEQQLGAGQTRSRRAR
ncbi:allantoin permease [Streptomyces hygroscopicus]|uniref:purine-cytosine permease family protein n=1 Tax=Streptomyces hygroscopicus TaxID=1912 RepID=UPI00224064F9|nr:cytosine permease [Streptomyces hygroscopicus]MCW7946496.1 allantoin permease [Streptomyces hygroscopicus]